METTICPTSSNRHSVGKISRRSAANDVYTVLRARIVGCHLQPGTRITENDLASQLNVSRTPLRHMIQRLLSEGWVERSAAGELRVATASKLELSSLYRVRKALEAMMIQECMKHLSVRDLNGLRDILNMQQEAANQGNLKDYLSHGESFHRALWSLANNSVGLSFLEIVYEKTLRYRHLAFSPKARSKQGLIEHWKILQALEERDEQESLDILKKHLESSEKYALLSFNKWQRQRSVSDVTPPHSQMKRKGPGRPRTEFVSIFDD